MLYLDTSIIVAYYCPEPFSEQVEAFMLGSEECFTVSHLTEVEFTSAISRKIRERTLNVQDGWKVLTQFDSHLKAGYFRRLVMNATHFEKARSWISRFDSSLRTLDALHLALSDCEGATLVTLDKQLFTAARLLHLETIGIEDIGYCDL